MPNSPLQKLSSLFGQRARKQALASASEKSAFQSYLMHPGEPMWSKRDYTQFADEAYRKNVIAYQSIHKLATSAASVPWELFRLTNGKRTPINKHPLLDLLARPSPNNSGSQFMEEVYAYRAISGNSYILIIKNEHAKPIELHSLRPDRVSIMTNKSGEVIGYRYQTGNNTKKYRRNAITGQSDILHLKYFNPIDDWYGQSPIEAASYSIDQHNEMAKWNKSLLQNSACPSGAIKVNSKSDLLLTPTQRDDIKYSINECFSGSANVGKPLLLDGNLEWQTIGVSPREMDFLEAKHSTARDIALAFGIPPQLLAIPGDNTYHNFAEARLAFWEQTILPLVNYMADHLNHWLVPHFGNDLYLSYNTDAISALAPRREYLWQRLENCSFMTDDEKREAVGLAPRVRV